VLLLTVTVHGQTVYGIVADGETHKGLVPVTIINLSTQQSTVTDEGGNFTLQAQSGETLSFSFLGYHTIQRLATPGTYMPVDMLPLSVLMKEYILHPDYTPFQRDSADIANTYSKELNTRRIKPGFSTADGGGFTGLIGSAVQKMSKSYKKNKVFKETVKKDLEQKFIDTRYTQGLVSALTGFNGDTLALFMNFYPMEYDFARTATDLELKMWIRSNAKQYMHRKVVE
jgi:hypothetical protein